MNVVTLGPKLSENNNIQYTAKSASGYVPSVPKSPPSSTNMAAMNMKPPICMLRVLMFRSMYMVSRHAGMPVLMAINSLLVVLRIDASLLTLPPSSRGKIVSRI